MDDGVGVCASYRIGGKRWGKAGRIKSSGSNQHYFPSSHDLYPGTI